MASITSSIHSFEIPVIYGYNIIKEGPYSLAVFGGPKIRYIWDKQSKVTFENFDQRDIERQLHGRRCRNDFTRILRLPL